MWGRRRRPNDTEYIPGKANLHEETDQGQPRRPFRTEHRDCRRLLRRQEEDGDSRQAGRFAEGRPQPGRSWWSEEQTMEWPAAVVGPIMVRSELGAPR